MNQSRVKDSKVARKAVNLTILTLVSCLTFSACSKNGVTISAPTPDAKTRKLCIKLIPELPKQVANQEMRDVLKSENSDPQISAAWGDPVISLRCGVPKPTDIKPTSQLITINGIDWFPEQLTKGWRFTSMNTNGFIEVTVPNKFQPEANALVDLSESLKPLLVASSS